MKNNPLKILKEKYNIVLPAPPAIGGVYSPIRKTGNLLYLSGQTPMVNGELKYKGVVGRDITVDEGREAAKIVAINLLSVLNVYLEGDFTKIKQIVQVFGVVRSAEGFSEQPQVINAASEIFVEIFGEAGRASRIAFGTNELPGGACVEILMIVEI